MKTSRMLAAILLIALLSLLAFMSLHSRADAGEKSKTSSDKAWLGIYMQDIDDELAKAFDIDADQGVLVDDIIDDSPADEAGIRRGDVIVKIDDTEIESSRDLTDLVEDHKPGDEVEVTILRDGEEKSYAVELDSRPRYRYSRSWDWGDDDRYVNLYFDNEGGFLGVYTEELSDQLAEYFEVDSGLLVKEVEEDTPAEEAGIKAGDVIVKVEDEYVDTPDDLRDVLSDFDEGDTVSIELSRKGGTMTVSAELDESPYGVYGSHFNMPSIPSLPSLPSMPSLQGLYDRGVFQMDEDEREEFKEEMDELREDLRNLKKELGELKEKLK
jgi:C-terminal processing protease CtpA/Prc